MYNYLTKSMSKNTGVKSDKTSDSQEGKTVFFVDLKNEKSISISDLIKKQSEGSKSC